MKKLALRLNKCDHISDYCTCKRKYGITYKACICCNQHHTAIFRSFCGTCYYSLTPLQMQLLKIRKL